MILAPAFLDAARLASLATGRGGLPTQHEWPFVILLLATIALVATRILRAVGLTRAEAILVGVSPALVLVDAPVGALSPQVGLAANATGCLIPAFVSLKILWERRAPAAELVFLVFLGIVTSYFASEVDPDRGVMLHYRVPALLVGVAAAGLFHATAGRAGAAGFMAGTIGVIVGADAFRLRELADGADAGRIVLGGAGMLDGILLVAVIAAASGEAGARLLQVARRLRVPKRRAVA